MSELTPMNYGRIIRPSIAHTIDKVNEVIDWINNSEIKSTKLVETGEGTEIQVGNATQLASLGMEGLAIQDGTPTPDNPIEIEVVRGHEITGQTGRYVDLIVKDANDVVLSITPIPLPSKGFAASLPDGTADTLTIDSVGRCEWESVSGEVVFDGSSDEGWSGNGNRVSIPFACKKQASGTESFNALCNRFNAQSPDGTYLGRIGFSSNTGGNSLFFSDGTKAMVLADWKTWLASNPITVLYPLATPTTEHAYIDMPKIPNNAKLKILATLEPGFSAGWFTEDALPMVVNALNARIESIGNDNQAETLENTRNHFETIEIGNETKQVEKQTEEQEEPEQAEEQEMEVN